MRGCLLVSVICLSVLALAGGLDTVRADSQLRTGPPVPAAPDIAEPVDRAALAALLSFYDAGDYASFDQRAARFSRSVTDWLLFDVELLPWIAQAPQDERRRLVAASVALELAFIEWRSPDTSVLLVEIGCLLLQPQAPSPAERSWHVAATELTRRHAPHALLRFPEHGAIRLPLAVDLEMLRAPAVESLFGAGPPPVWLDAAAVDQLAAGSPGPIMNLPANRRMDRASTEKLLTIAPELRTMRPPPPESDKEPNGVLVTVGLWDVVDGYRGVIERDPTIAEAHLRLGQAYVRLARPAEALLSFRQAEETATTTYVRYLARLLGGGVFERIGRRTEAMQAFRGALAVVPRAQSATLALAPLLFQSGDREEASDMLEAVVRPPVASDPLQIYWERDPERWPQYIANVRQALR